MRPGRERETEMNTEETMLIEIVIHSPSECPPEDEGDQATTEELYLTRSGADRRLACLRGSGADMGLVEERELTRAEAVEAGYEL